MQPAVITLLLGVLFIFVILLIPGSSPTFVLFLFFPTFFLCYIKRPHDSINTIELTIFYKIRTHLQKQFVVADDSNLPSRGGFFPSLNCLNDGHFFCLLIYELFNSFYSFCYIRSVFRHLLVNK